MSARAERSELLVGIFVLGGLILLGGLLFQFGKFGSKGRDSYRLSAVVRDASGIREGVPVRLGGVEIGFVGGDPVLGESFSNLILDLRIYQGQRIPRSAEVRIGTSGLLGDSFIRITPPTEPVESFYEPGERIEASGASSIDDIATGAVATLEKAAKVLGEIGESVQQLNAVFERFDEGVLREENIENLNVILEQLRTSSDRFEKATQRLDPILSEAELAAVGVKEAAVKADEAFDQVGDSLGGFNEAVGTVDPVVKELDLTLDELKETLQSIDGLVGQIEHGDGLAAALLNDPELRRDLSSFVDKLNRNGILRYPREGGRVAETSGRSAPARGRSSDPSTKSSKSSETSSGKKGLFPWLKKKQ